MLSKRERFQRWRGVESSAEQHYLDAALYISDYVDSVDSLEAIKTGIATKLKHFHQNNNLIWGILLFTRLFAEEAIEQLVEPADTENALFETINAVVSTLYLNKNEISKNISVLMVTVEKLLALDTIRFTDKEQNRKFLFSAYMIFQCIRHSLDKLDWKLKILVALFINIEKTKLKMDQFLIEVEKKAAQHDQGELLVEQSDAVEHDPLKRIKILLNKRYLKVLIGNASQIHHSKKVRSISEPTLQPAEKKTVGRTIQDRLFELEMDVDKVSSVISTVLDLREQTVGVEIKIRKIRDFLHLVEENDRNITGKKNFLAFIESHSESYHFLLEHSDEQHKVQFIDQVNQLRKAVDTSVLSTSVLNTVSWVATPITLAYRAAVPQKVQDVIASTLPTSLESKCFSGLKELAHSVVDDFQKHVEKKERELIAIKSRLFHHDEELRKSIDEERSDQLVLLLKANMGVKEAVHASRTMFITVQKRLHFLNDLKKKNGTLKAFITLHDGILVKISNFLAQFFLFFKTDTAKMIDNVSALKKKIDGLVDEYQSSVDQELRQLEQSTDLDPRIKRHLTRQFKRDESEISEEQRNQLLPTKHNVRLLIDNLSHLFTQKSEQEMPKEVESRVVLV